MSSKRLRAVWVPVTYCKQMCMCVCDMSLSDEKNSYARAGIVVMFNKVYLLL